MITGGPWTSDSSASTLFALKLIPLWRYLNVPFIGEQVHGHHPMKEAQGRHFHLPSCPRLCSTPVKKGMSGQEVQGSGSLLSLLEQIQGGGCRQWTHLALMWPWPEGGCCNPAPHGSGGGEPAMQSFSCSSSSMLAFSPSCSQTTSGKRLRGIKEPGQKRTSVILGLVWSCFPLSFLLFSLMCNFSAQRTYWLSS